MKKDGYEAATDSVKGDIGVKKLPIPDGRGSEAHVGTLLRRKKKRGEKKIRPLSMTLFFALLIMLELLVIVAGSSGILELLHSSFKSSDKVPDVVWLTSISIVLGTATTVFLIRFFSSPILTLGRSIKRVADGDFSVRLDTDRGFSEIRKINANFNLMVKELSATEILQTDFVSNVSHEFKTPINAIEGYATLLSGTSDVTPEQQEYIEKILLSTHRLSSLVGNILLLSKVDNQAIQQKPVTYRLDEQVRQAIVDLEPEWTRNDCELDVDLENITYTGGETLLYHVFTNIIGNAIKFGKRGGCVSISLKATDGGCDFTVIDDGDGISEDSIEHIFDRFYQSDSSHKAEGNGLGLALVKQILIAEGGEVRAENVSPHGAKFTVSLKIKSTEQ